MTNEGVRRSIKAERTRKGYSQEDVAKKLGITKATVCKMENNPFESKLVNLKKYADILEIPMNIFLGL